MFGTFFIVNKLFVKQFDTDIEKLWLGACACFALGVPATVQSMESKSSPPKKTDSASSGRITILP